MSCVLRIASDKLDLILGGISLKPYRLQGGTAHFQVSECDFDNLPGQVRDAVSFLSLRRHEIAALMAASTASGVLDFAVEGAGSEVRFAALPAVLVREAGALGLALELSQYPKE